ncbi:MAG: C-GCAxxG-C-C family protein [Clostridiales bacterium]|nr:C-GCAxxG-C-C family protein [Clostridiales bacterium]
MENQYIEHAVRLRAITEIHYNCAQAVLVPFASVCGISEEKAYQLGAHFGSGMKMGSVCGAVTGALMVIGMLGGTDDQYRAFMKMMRDNHGISLNCVDLLKKNQEAGQEKKVHCDHMVYEAIADLTEVMQL